MNRGLLSIKERVGNFSIHQLGQEPMLAPENIRPTSFHEAIAEIREIEECYAQIFGGEEWRLAYYCTAEGFGKRFSNAEYERMAQPCCDCGAALDRCLIDNSLVQEILYRLHEHRAFLFLQRSYAQITGFSIGLLFDCSQIAEQAITDCYNPEIANELLQAEVSRAVDSYCRKYGIKGEVFYGLSGGLLPKARTGLAPVLFLFRFLLYHAYLFGQGKFFAVTHRNTPMLEITLSLGADILYEFEDGSVMIGYHDVTPVLSLLQNLTIDEVKWIMRENGCELDRSASSSVRNACTPASNSINN